MHITKPALTAIAVLGMLFAVVAELAAAPIECSDQGPASNNIIPGGLTFASWTATSDPPGAGFVTVVPPGTTEAFIFPGSTFPIPIETYPTNFAVLTDIGPGRVTFTSPPFSVPSSPTAPPGSTLPFMFSWCSAFDNYEQPRQSQMTVSLLSTTTEAFDSSSVSSSLALMETVLFSEIGQSVFDDEGKTDPSDPVFREFIVSLLAGSAVSIAVSIGAIDHGTVGTTSPFVGSQVVPEPSPALLLITGGSVMSWIAVLNKRRKGTYQSPADLR